MGNKPWLKYHKEGAPVREFHAHAKKPRELFWARFWLITGSHIGAHRLYLWKYKSAALWIVGFQIATPVFLLICIGLFPQDDGRVISILALIFWLAVLALEYVRLSKMVSQANKLNFENLTDDDYRLRGEIGPFGAMKGVVRWSALFFFICIIVFLLLGENNLLVGAMLVLFMLCLLVMYRQYLSIEKRQRSREPHDRP